MSRAVRAVRNTAVIAVVAVGVPLGLERAASALVSESAPVSDAAPASGAALAGGSASGSASGRPDRTVEVWMAGDESAAQRFVNAVSRPGSAQYERYLSPRAYTLRFGPSTGQVRAVSAYLRSAGFRAIQASADDDYISAQAPADVIRRDFSRPGDTTGAATAGLPAPIRRAVLAITGLDGSTISDNLAPGAHLSGPGFPGDCSAYWAQKTATLSPAYDGLTQAAIPVCGYSARQIRHAYGASATATGRGTTIAFIQVGAPDDMLRSLRDFAARNGLPRPRADQYHEVSVDGGASNPKCLDGAQEEAAIDSESAYTMAPGADQLMVDGNDCGTSDAAAAQALLDAMLYPLTGAGPRPKARIESVSYGLSDFSEAQVPRAELRASHAVALRAAAEGVSLLVATGDQPGLEPPATDPDVTAVGGTTLGVGADDRRVFETGWSTTFGERVGTSSPWQPGIGMLGAGGGASNVYAEPAYQKRVVPASMARDAAGRAGRTVPDVSADADPYSGMLFGSIVLRRNGTPLGYESFRQAGTSMATPLVAGMVADAEQGQRRSFGFLNPRLYRLANTAAFHDILPVSAADPEVDRDFFSAGDTDIKNVFRYGEVVGLNDVQGVPGTVQVTAPGYDTMTGLGTPDGMAFVRGLRSGR